MPNRWLLRVRLLGFAVAVLMLPGLTVVAWLQVHSDAVVQAGPHVVAQVDRVHVTSYSSRSGRHWTSRYRVHFVAGNRTIRTTVTASGSDPCACATTLVAYDPGHPQRAELVGVRRGSVAGAAVLSVMSLLLVGMAFLLLRRRGSLVPMRPRRIRPAPVALVASLVLTAVVALTFGLRFRSGGPSQALEHRVISAALAGQGTTECLAQPPLPASPRAPSAQWVRAALRSLGTTVPPASSGAPHWYAGRSAFDSGLEPTFLRLGGDQPAPGFPSTAYGSWLGSAGHPGFEAVDVWQLASPQSAARFADVYLAASCYRFARYSGTAAGMVTPADPRPGARYWVTGDGNSSGLVVAMAEATVGSFVVRTEVEGPPGQRPELVQQAAASLARALDSPDTTAG